MDSLLLLMVAAALLAVVWVPAVAGAAVVTESARRIPVAYDVDVVVVGGSTAGVEAAVAAAEAGATVFLAAPRPYLGEDLCATKRLWLEADETPPTPLGLKLFADTGEVLAAKDPRALPFTYEADLPSAGVHKDQRPPRLTDGVLGPPEKQSVQYDGDVTILCDLGKVQDVADVRAVVFHRGGDFGLGGATVETSADGKTWTRAVALETDGGDGGSITAGATIDARARHARLHLKRAEGTERILVGEVMLLAPKGKVPSDAKPAEPAVNRGPVRPMHVKKTLDEAALAAGVRFLFGCYATGVLTDGGGKPAGIVMANRSGRQAVLAKVIIDATDRAAVARIAGAEFRPYPKGTHEFRRVVIGGEVQEAKGVAGRAVGLKFGSAEIIEYTLRLPMADSSYASFAEANQKAIDATFHPQRLDASEVLFQVPPDPVKGKASMTGAWPGAAEANLDAFRPAAMERLYVVGGCADVPRDVAARLLRPTVLMAVGARIGRAAAAEAKQVGNLEGVRLAGKKSEAATGGDVKEFLGGLRPTQGDSPTVPADERSVPVLGTYDVVVIGGGTGGAPAGIGAGRHKARTLVVEYLHGLGGVGTLGMITKYYHGYRDGFTAEADEGTKAIGARVWGIGKAEYWRQANREAGTDVWFWCLGAGAFVEDGTVKGAVVVTPEGRGVVLAKTVIDATGNADIAAAAGAETTYTGAEHMGIQGTGLPPIRLGAGYTNTDYTFADDTDVVDFWHLFVTAREKFKGAYDLGQLVDTRERRRIVGDVTISPMDMILGRTWPDTISVHKSNFDSHGFAVHPVFLLRPPGHEDIFVNVPFRALLPKGLDGILVTGLGVSAHRDAIPVIRMQPCVQNQGYAAGTAAAIASRSAASIRNIDLRSVQEELVEKESLPKTILEFQDTFPLPKERVAEAVRNAGKADGGHAALAVILSQPETAVPMLREAHAAAKSADEALACAHILGMLWDPAGAETLAAAVKGATEFDKGWNYRGMGQFGMSISTLDSYIIALGRTRDGRAYDAILEKVALLDASKEFSHHRACALALEALAAAPNAPKAGLKRAAEALGALLAKPDMTGYATPTVDAARGQTEPSGTSTVPRNNSLRELVVARALYRLGDHEGVGEKILKAYACDLRGHYARHAAAVLAERK